MNIEQQTIERTDMGRLLGAANADAALLYLYLRCGNPPESAQEALKLSESRVTSAMALLGQLGLWQDAPKRILAGERPAYNEQDVVSAERDKDFLYARDRIEEHLGKRLNTEELKIILGFMRYLGMDGMLIELLVRYCIMRARQKGSLRTPSLRVIEKEAYAWAERGIETQEDAAAYINLQVQRNSQLGRLMQTLQIRGRMLTPGEEKYATRWLEMGFETDAFELAYDRTCLNTGGMNWAYMNKILTRWYEAGLMNAEQIKQGDRKPQVPKGASGQLGEAELENIQRLLREG